MSSSPDITANQANPQAQSYVYPPPSNPGSGPKSPSADSNASTLEHLWVPDAGVTGPPPISEEQLRLREERARREGREEAAALGRAELEKSLTAERQILTQAVRDFARERETYFQRVEAEVVKLAVAIARKILHREAQVDPLLLAGVVRVGLDKIAAGTRVRLKVHPQQIQAWSQFFSQQPNLQAVPELMGDASLGVGRCLLETDLGSTDLTLETQLKEIEQGFFDLLAQRPKEP